MYQDFRAHTADVYRKTGGATLGTALAYEDFSSGMHALQTFQELLGGMQKTFDLNLRNVWKFDFLRFPQLREDAITETVCADLVIVSMRTPRELPTSVKWWIHAALEQREQDPGALVLMYSENPSDGPTPSPAEAYLTQCARTAGMDFFVKHPGAPRELRQPVPPFIREQISGIRVPATGREARPAGSHRRFSLEDWA